MTGFADVLSLMVDRAVMGTTLAARSNVPGAVDDRGVTAQQWADHYAGQMRDLQKMVARRLDDAERMEKALCIDHRPSADALAKAAGGAMADSVTGLSKAWGDIRDVQTAIAAERPAYEALAKRIADYLAEPAIRPGSPSYGTPMHLVGRAIH